MVHEIAESRAIARYLAEKYQSQGTPLLGTTRKEKAAIHQWTETEAHIFTPACSTMVRELFLAELRDRPVNSEIIETSSADFTKVLDIYEAHLKSQGTKYLAGENYSLAEVFHAAHLRFLMPRVPQFFENRPHLLAWGTRISTRPALQKCCELDWNSAAPLSQ